ILPTQINKTRKRLPYSADSWADRTPLHEAACQGRLLQLRDLITEGFHVDTLTMDRVSPLHEACLGGHYACAKFLLDKGANVNIISTDGATPLFNACSSGNAACVRLILQCTAFIHQAHQLASPIHEAAKQGHSECLELLLSYGAHIDLELPVLGTPLYCACLTRATDCYICLFALGPCSLSQLCRLSVRRSLGKSRLHAASSLFLPRSIKAFLLYH
uniref:Ankyrin repeat and SOCS box protein 11 n=1 Tax=Periophthalmus magnuspinnatus TaxID=409849 RepID=A0A3B4A8Q2_9GOBI